MVMFNVGVGNFASEKNRNEKSNPFHNNTK